VGRSKEAHKFSPEKDLLEEIFLVVNRHAGLISGRGDRNKKKEDAMGEEEGALTPGKKSGRAVRNKIAMRLEKHEHHREQGAKYGPGA